MSILESATEVMGEIEDCIADVVIAKRKIKKLFKQATVLQCSKEALSDKAVSKAELMESGKPYFEEIKTKASELAELNEKLRGVAESAVLVKCGGGGGGGKT